MNNYKKIAAAVVSTVMAGTMVFSFTACQPDNPDGPNGGGETGVEKLVKHMTDSGSQVRETTLATGWTTAKSYWTYLKDHRTASADTYHVLNTDGTINYEAYARSSEVTLNIAIGHNSNITGAFYNDLKSQITLPDGKNYEDGNLKPAWAQLGKDLNIKFSDAYHGWATNANLTNILAGNDGANYANIDLLTSDLSFAVSAAASGTSVLNLANYLDAMPNFKAFLEANPIVYLSLLQDGMNTTDGKGQTLYVAPYFDGNDDIERYCIVRQDWVKKLLDGTDALAEAGTAYKDSCAQSTSAVSYMGTTGKYEIESANEAGTGKVTIVKNYDAALTAAKNESTPLGAAYKAIAGAAYTGESGNIVDIMNAALAAKSDATGSQLVSLYRAYIDVCYEDKAQGGAYYTSSTRSNLFNGYDACWDVDDLVAILRCVKTNAKTLVGDKQIAGIVPRSGQNDRTPDMVRLAAQLYGVKGADSRFEYTYIDNQGNLQDARNDKDFYQAFVNMNTLTKEGLIEDYSGISAFTFAKATTKDKDAFMMYDYSQTQTLDGFTKTDPATYYLSPIVTPVSKWDVDGDGNHTDIMRFTESWRSTKTSGLMLNGALANTGNEEKLKAAIQLVDYLYSEDGQIVSTYGPMANANGAGGFWYNEPLANQNETDTSKYFTYKGVKYSGTNYKGKITPTVTTNLLDSFGDKSVNGFKLSDNENIAKAKYNFTNYARMLIGSTLPVGVKDQSFENQLTSNCGKAGADKVGANLALGTVKGLTLEINENNWWYTCVPTSLPVASNLVNDVLDASSQDHLKQMTGVQMKGGDKNFYSIMNYIILYGLTGTYNQQNQQYAF